MKKQTIAYNLENNMRTLLEKYPTRTLRCLIGAAAAIRNNAAEYCDGKVFDIKHKDDNIHLHVIKGSLIVSFKNSFGYEFSYDETKGAFKVLPFLHWSFNPENKLRLAEIKTFEAEMQNEINHDAYLPRWIKAVIDAALMPANEE